MNIRQELRYISLPFLAAAALCAQQSGTEIKMQWALQQPGGKTGVKREEFSKQAKPGPGKELRVFVLANKECTVSFAGFTRDGQLVYGLPETVHLPANIVKELPVSNKWTFDGHEQLAEMDAVIADPAAADFKRYADIIARMSRPGISVEVRQAQAGLLREWLDAEFQSKTTAHDLTVKENPTEIGGLVRGDFSGQTFMVPARKTSVVRIRIR
jgi:hypothetical protein